MGIPHVGLLVNGLSWAPSQQQAVSLEVSHPGHPSPTKSPDNSGHPGTTPDTMGSGTTSQSRGLGERIIFFLSLYVWGSLFHNRWLELRPLVTTCFVCSTIPCSYWRSYWLRHTMLILTQASLAVSVAPGDLKPTLGTREEVHGKLPRVTHPPHIGYLQYCPRQYSSLSHRARKIPRRDCGRLS